MQRITILNRQKNDTKSFHDLILAAPRGEVSMRRISDITTRVAGAVTEGIPKGAGEVLVPFGNFARSVILGVSIGVSESLETVADVLQVQQMIQEQAKEENDLQIAIDVQTAEQNFELLQSIEELNHTVRNEISLRLELYNQAEVVRQTLARYLAQLAEDQRLIDELERFRKATAAQVTEHRYEDMTFRIFRNDALQKYHASFDIAARDVYLAANAYDPTQFSTKIARAGVWFSGSDGTQVSQSPRIYLVPVGMDIQRSPTGDTLATREWRIIDQAVPPPFPIGASDLSAPDWIPLNDTLGGTFAQIRRYGSLAAKHDRGIYSEDDLTNDTRLIGRSAWNTEWMLIIPGGTLLFDPDQGLNVFINTVTDIKIFFQTYSYTGN